VMLDLRLGDAHPIHFPFDVFHGGKAGFAAEPTIAPDRSVSCSFRRSMGLWARTTARMWLFCNSVVVIGDW
jgi:hypothetical protein